jgi:hypothetical protein
LTEIPHEPDSRADQPEGVGAVFGFVAGTFEGAVDIMKRFGLLVISLLALAAPAFGQVGVLGIYADDQGNNCNISDPGGVLSNNVNVVHKFDPGDGATAVRFRIDPPVGANWTFLAFSTIYTPSGSVGTDISIGYGTCTQLTTLVGTAIISSVTPSPACGQVIISPGFTATVLAADCSFNEFPMPTPGKGIANPDGTCQCNIAVEETTWGKVKSLYR